MKKIVLFVCLVSQFLVAQNQWKVFNTQNSSVPGDAFYCIGIDLNENIWLAHHIVCKWDKMNSTCYYNYPYLGSDIVKIQADLEGFVWLSLESSWVIKTDGNYWETHFLPNAMWAVTIDRENVLWGGGGQRPLKGLHKFDGNSWVVYDTTNSLLPHPFVAQLTSDINGKIWGIAEGYNGRALFSYDGYNWNTFTTIFPPVWVSTMVADEQGNVWYATALPQGGNEGIVQFNGMEFIFHSKPDSISSLFPLKLLTDSKDNLWVCWGDGVSNFSNGVWTVYKDTINYNFSDMTIDSDDNKWFSTYGDGVIIFNESGLVLSNDDFTENKLVEDFLLAQNYPNPFNPTTKIKYQIPEDSFVTLKLYGVLCNEIATLVNEEQPAGIHEVEFNALKNSWFPASGVYIYQLRAGSFVETKKMILLK